MSEWPVPLQITSRHNVRIQQLLKLRERRQRDKMGKVLIEGYRELLRALEGGVLLEELYICPDLFLGENEPALIEACQKAGGRIVSLPEELFHRVSYRDRPDGLIGIAQREVKGLSTLRLGSCPLLVVAEGIEKPGNLGTILRTSDAVGIDGLIVCDQCTDIANPNVVRASVGTLFTQPVVEATSDETLTYLRERQIRIVAATPEAKLTYTQADLTGPIAVAVGCEQLGLSAKWRENADIQVSIPMKGHADSLNVAMATAVILFEALRQRTA